MTNEVQRELCTSRLHHQKSLWHCQMCAAGGSLFWWRIVAVVMHTQRKLLTEFLCSGERQVGDAEVNAGHRRRQTGSNWREPVSLSPPTTASRWRGSWWTGEERGRKRRRETDSRKKDTRINSERRISRRSLRVDSCWIYSGVFRFATKLDIARHRIYRNVGIGCPSNLTVEHLSALCFTSKQ